MLLFLLLLMNPYENARSQPINDIITSSFESECRRKGEKLTNIYNLSISSSNDSIMQGTHRTVCMANIQSSHDDIRFSETRLYVFHANNLKVRSLLKIDYKSLDIRQLTVRFFSLRPRHIAIFTLDDVDNTT